MLDIKQDELLSNHTTFHIGGEAKYFVVVKNAEELREVFEWAKERGEKYFVLGGGSNVLFSDDGFDGLVIKAQIMDFEIQDDVVILGAGLPLLLAVKKTATAGLGGLENFAGIPGTVGGAVANNAGAFGSSIGEFVEKAEILNFGFPKPKIINRVWFDFKYRSSKLKASRLSLDAPILLRVWLKLQKREVGELENKIAEILGERASKEPKGFCAGCAFKNIKGEKVLELCEKFDFSPEERERFLSRKAIPTAWLIEHAGLKGKKIGGAYIPEEHANYIMNDNTAKARDIIEMIKFIKQKVKEKFEIELEEEIQIIS